MNDIPTGWENPCSNGERLADGHLGGTSDKGDGNTWYPELWDWLIKEFEVKSVLDVGCGLGFSLRWFLEQGLDTVGVEGYSVCRDLSPVKDHIVLHDYTQGPLHLGRSFDMVYSSEFCEHVEELYVPNFLNCFNRATRVLCITAADDRVGGYHHVNSRPSSYWIERIEPLGLKYNEELTEQGRSLVPFGVNKRYGHEPLGKSLFQLNGLIFTRTDYV